LLILESRFEDDTTLLINANPQDRDYVVTYCFVSVIMVNDLGCVYKDAAQGVSTQ